MLRKTALKGLHIHNRKRAERYLRKMTFVSPCPQGQNRCESTGSALAGSCAVGCFP
ncbi:MAG: hypothetical protein LBV41_09315 [Cytophagaceae bacterium]|nr:hypothetical protein [Cytophagaceae bacterium]